MLRYIMFHCVILHYITLCITYVNSASLTFICYFFLAFILLPVLKVTTISPEVAQCYCPTAHSARLVFCLQTGQSSDSNEEGPCFLWPVLMGNLCWGTSLLWCKLLKATRIAAVGPNLHFGCLKHKLGTGLCEHVCGQISTILIASSLWTCFLRCQYNTDCAFVDSFLVFTVQCWLCISGNILDGISTD